MSRQFPRAEHPFFEVKAAARNDGEPTATDIWIYDVIGDDWWEPSLTAKELMQQIAAIETDEIVLHLSSPGGSVTDGMAIYNALIAHPARVTSLIEGWTGSIATVVALAGEEIRMFDNVMFMIHRAWTVCIGDANDLRDMAGEMDRVDELMSRIYMRRCTKSEDDLRAAMDGETYMDAAEAAEWGFVDEVIEAKVAAAALAVDPRTMERFKALGFRPEAAGRTISAENESKLTEARDLIDEVLSPLDARSTEPAPAAPGDAAATMDGKQIASILLTSRRH
ncbi:MAG TPA: Clp protease ClpP [Thermoleophilia bacterium]|nr:Clp protease ClpP [Thermoleophilia bacterium]